MGKDVSKRPRASLRADAEPAELPFSSDVQAALQFLGDAIARHERHMDGSESTSKASQQAMMDEMVAARGALEQAPEMEGAARVARETLAVRAATPELQFRMMTLTVDREALQTRAQDAESDTLPVSISSEYPVERFDWWENQRYLEVLEHSPEAVDLSRAQGGLPFLDSHDTRVQLGRVVDVALGKDRRLHGIVRFSKRPDAQALREDILDDIRVEVSVGYRVDPNNLEKSQAKGEALPTVRIKRWTPYEVSSVAIPADPTVGVGRDLRSGVSLLGLASRLTQPAPTAEETPVKKEEPNGAPDGANRNGDGAGAAVAVTRSDEPSEAQEIAQLAETHAMQDQLPKWIGRGLTKQQVVMEINRELQDRLKKGPQVTAVQLSDKEEREYSYVRAINAAMDGKPCFEREIHDQLFSDLPQGYKSKSGFLVLTNLRRFHPDAGRPVRNGGYGLTPLQQRAGLDSITATKGQELKFTEYGGFIDMLRNKARVLQAGATFMGGLKGPTTFVKQNGAGTFSWQTENPGADAAESNLTLTTVTLIPKTGISTTSYSRQLLRVGVEDVELMVRNDLAAIHALGIDAGALFGSGAAGQPQGLFTAAGVAIVALGVNGAAPTYVACVQLTIEPKKANADLGAMAVITTPGIEGTLKTTQQFAGTNGVPVWVNDRVADVPAFSSNQVQANLTKGTGTNLHAAYAGVWSQLVIGEWGAMEFLVDELRLKKQGMIEVTTFQMIDVAIRHAGAFAVIKDAISSM